MRWIKHRMVMVGLIAALSSGWVAVPVSQAVADQQYATQDSHSSFNDEYVFATTRGLNDMEGVHPALKLPLFPVTVVLDTIFLPFAIIAGFVT